MKEGAENVQTKIQAKVESLKTTGEHEKGRIFVLCYFKGSLLTFNKY